MTIGQAIRDLEPPIYGPGVDVIVVSYQTPQDLEAFLASYVEHPVDAPSTMWIGNVSPGPSDRQVADNFANLTHHFVGGAYPYEFDENIGFNRAVNRLGAAGMREYVAVFNADVELRAGALTELVAALDQHPEWAAVGPRQVDDQGLLTCSGIFGTGAQPEWRCWREPGVDGRFSDVRDDCVTIIGSAFVIRRSVWDELTRCLLYRNVAPDAIGPMLPCAHYYGETALMYHARAHDWKLGYLGTTTIVHRWHTASQIGGWGEQHRDDDQRYFREFCDVHSIERD